MRRMAIWSLLSLLVLFSVGAWAATITVPATDQPPKIDGTLDDTCWKDAAKIGDFHILGSDQKSAAATTAWLAYDQDWLYLAVRCQDEPGKTIVAQRKGRGTGANWDDSIEVFVGYAPSEYYHFVLGAGGAKYEQKVLGERKYLDWQVPWPSATKVERSVWTAELAIPLYALGDGKLPANPLVFNLTRNKRTEAQQYITWAPVVKGFHDPEKFGQLTGLEGKAVRLVCAPVISQAYARNYVMKDGKYSYEIAVKISNYGGESGRANLIVEDTPAGQTTRKVSDTISVAALEEQKEFIISVPVAMPGDRSATVRIGEAGEALPVEQMGNLSPLRFYLDRNYYTTEQEAQVICETVFPREELNKLQLNLLVKDEKGKLVGKQTLRCSKGMRFTLPVSRLQPGDYPIEVSLKMRSGQMVAKQEGILTKYPPAPAGITELKFDQENERLLLNGKPWFPLGFLMYGGISEDAIKELAESGFDTMVRWWVVGGRNLSHLPKAVEHLDLAQKAGLYVFESSTGYAEGPLRYAHPDLRKNYLKSVENLPKVIPTLSKHPAVVGYYGLDEPGKEFFDLGKLTYDVVHELDPYHLQYSSSCGVWPDEGYEIFDLLGVHAYWDPVASSYIPLANKAHAMRQVARRHHRAFMATPQSDRGDFARNLTPDEARCTAYLGVIQGAKGIIYFAYYGNHHPLYWKVMSSIAREMRELSPALLELDPPQNVQVKITTEKIPPALPPAPADQFSGAKSEAKPWYQLELPLVQVLVKDWPEGGELILAANSWRDPVDAVFAVSSLGSQAKVKELFTGKGYRVKDGCFEDRFEPFGVRVYVTEGSTRKHGDALRVGVNIVKLAEEEKPEEQVGPNLVQNPGFEEDGGWNLGAGKIVGEVAHSGKRSLRVDAPAEASHAGSSTFVQLEPRTKYRIGAWVKSDIRKGAKPPNFYFYGIAGYTIPMVQTEWKRLGTTIRTGDEPRKLQIGPRVYQGEGTVWVDDISVAPIEEVKPKNMVMNSSFEEATLPGWPDYWSGPHQDESTAYHGRYSLRIHWPRERPHYWVNAANVFPFKDREPGRPYTFSLYMKAEREDFPVELWLYGKGGGGKVSQEVKVGTEWKRYAIPIVIPREEWQLKKWWHGGCNLCIRLMGKGTIWVDAVQFEEGTEATAYQPDDYQAPKIDEKWLR